MTNEHNQQNASGIHPLNDETLINAARDYTLASEDVGALLTYLCDALRAHKSQVKSHLFGQSIKSVYTLIAGLNYAAVTLEKAKGLLGIALDEVLNVQGMERGDHE